MHMLTPAAQTELKQSENTAIGVSPGLRPRPSLNGCSSWTSATCTARVAGASAPALIERLLVMDQRDLHRACHRGFGPGPH